MISIYALTERLAPARVATAITVVCAGGPVGTAVGQTLAGALVDSHGYRAAFLLTPVLAGLGVVVALTTRFSGGRRRGTRAERVPQPTAARR
jgi:predicted MFS family arabinose efflux permease